MKAKYHQMISVVIPAYNEQDNIANCLKSLCNQDTAKAFEVILVDNNSTDDTSRIASTFYKRLNLRIIKENKKGRGAARKAGFDLAKGKCIFSTDADTVHPQDWIESLLKGFKGDAVAVTGPCRINDCDHIRNSFFNFLQPLIIRAYRIVFGYYILSGFNFAIKKNVYDQLKGFDAELNYMEDIDLSIQVSKIGKIRFLKKCTVTFSGRRFKRGLFAGLFDYVPSFFKYHLGNRNDVYLSDPR